MLQGYTPATRGKVTRQSTEIYRGEKIGGLEVLFRFKGPKGGGVHKVWVHERHLDWERDWQMLHWHLVHGTWGYRLLKVLRYDPEGKKVAILVQCQYRRACKQGL